MNACQNCDWRGPDDEMDDIQRLGARVEPGESMPSGQCPRCGALCQPVNVIEVVLISPIPTREYGEPELIGPFNEGFGQDYIDNHITLGDGYEASVLVLKNPDES